MVVGESHTHGPRRNLGLDMLLSLLVFMKIPVLLLKGGKQIQLSLILCLIGAGIHLHLAAQILFLYFMGPCSIAHGNLIHMNTKILQLMHRFWINGHWINLRVS